MRRLLALFASAVTMNWRPATATVLAVVVLLGGSGCLGARKPAGPGATPEGGEAAPAGEVTLTWVAYRQDDVAMFEVYRGASADGPWKLVTSENEIIQGEGFSNEPRQYSFTDRGLVPRQVYYHYIGKVSLTGKRGRFTRPLASRAHLPEEKKPGDKPAGRTLPATTPTPDSGNK